MSLRVGVPGKKSVLKIYKDLIHTERKQNSQKVPLLFNNQTCVDRHIKNWEKQYIFKLSVIILYFECNELWTYSLLITLSTLINPFPFPSGGPSFQQSIPSSFQSSRAYANKPHHVQKTALHIVPPHPLVPTHLSAMLAGTVKWSLKLSTSTSYESLPLSVPTVVRSFLGQGCELH